LAAARATWQPHRTAIDRIEQELRNSLRPAMWTANHDAMRAGIGHRCATARRAKAANRRVAGAEARIAAICAGAADVKQRLDAFEASAWNLRDLAHPSLGGIGLDDVHREQLHDI
jgi:hypothetical protein